MISQKFKAFVVKGDFIHEDEDGFKAMLSRLDGKEVEVIVRPWKNQRSDPQNRYLHGYIIKEISNFLGYTPEETKEVLKYKFLRAWRPIKTKEGMKEVEYVKNTRDLDTGSMEQFLTEVREWASLELGLYLALPNEVFTE